MSAVQTLTALRECLQRHQLLRPDACLVAAVSGGSDSMSLLASLHLLQQEAGFTLHACHVQHGLRGDASLADERFVRDFCQSRSIPLAVHTADLGGDLHLPGMETRARECRYAFFANEMQRLSAHALLLAHHQDDQTETLLMHLLRGAGTNGLAGMRSSVPFACGLLLRPFLSLSKTDLLEALTCWNIPHREDASNQETLTLRNALRLQVLPLLEELSPGCSGRMAQAARLLQRDEDALNRQTVRLIRENVLIADGLHAILIQPLRQMDEAFALRALRLWYGEGRRLQGHEPDERHLSAADSERLLAFALSTEAPNVLNLPDGLQACRGSRWLHLTRQDGSSADGKPVPDPIALLPLLSRRSTDSPLQGTLLLPGWNARNSHSLLILNLCQETSAEPPTSALTACLPMDWGKECVLRTPLPGDTIHPLGAPGAKPLRRYLTDRKIDPPFRPRLPVLARGDTILWIPGLCTAQQLACQPNTPCLRLTLSQTPPYLTTHKGDKRHG
ncbi:MAG: tRNA lysidine(34) synthetase TilS [Clostridia bacterium]|nr:tRNA lysidine(34) synthetase TilS [Clostridia bacterium]